MIDKSFLKKTAIVFLISIILYVLLAFLLTKKDQQQLNFIKKEIDLPLSCPPRIIKEGDLDSIVQHAKNNFVKIEGIPEPFSSLFFTVCHYFPELKSTQITIVYEPIPTTMQTQPLFKFLYESDRSYKISINSDPDFEGISFKDIPYNGQVGIIAHEFCHILDYEYKNDIQLVGTGLKFLSKSSQELYEKSIDELTIYKGFGYQLYDWSAFATTNANSTLEYRDFKKKVYLEPTEISHIMANNPNYCQ